MKHIRWMFTLLIAALVSMGSAANLTGYLPNNTLFATGGVGLKDHDGLFDTFIDAWEKSGLTNYFMDLAEDELDISSSGMPSAFTQEEAMELFHGVVGEEVWLAVGSNFFDSEDMTPDIVVVASLSADAQNALLATFQDDVADGVLTQTEHDGMTIYADSVEEFAVGIDNGTLVMGVNPEGVLEARSRNLNRMAGLAQSPAWASTVGALGEGELYTFFNLSALGESALMLEFLAGEGIGTRVQGIVDALGAFGTVVRVTNDGLETETRMATGIGQNPDAGLVAIFEAQANYNLNSDLEHFTPAGALAFQSGKGDFAAGWNWFNNLFVGMPLLQEIGLMGSPNDLIAAFIGIDVAADLLGLTTGEFAAITMAYPNTDAIDPFSMDVATMDFSTLAGDMLFVVGVTDAALATETMAQLFPTIGMFTSMMMDPFGEEMNIPSPVTTEVNGATVYGWPMLGGETGDFFHVTVDNYLIFGTKESTVIESMNAYGAKAGLPPSLPDVAGVPANATSVSHQNTQAAFNSITASYASQLSMMSSLLTDMDEDVDSAQFDMMLDAFGDFLAFVTSRFSYASGYSTYENGVSVSYSKTLINW